MSQIHQIQFQFLSIEDRMLLKINTTTKEEFRFLLTRRFVSLLYPILTKILHGHESISIHQNDRIRHEMINLQQEAAIQKINNAIPYQCNQHTRPLGSKPILLAKISTSSKNNVLQLTLEPAKGPGISFTIDQNLIHLLRHLLLDCLEKTDWQLGYQDAVTATQRTLYSGKEYLH